MHYFPRIFVRKPKMASQAANTFLQGKLFLRSNNTAVKF